MALPCRPLVQVGGAPGGAWAAAPACRPAPVPSHAAAAAALAPRRTQQAPLLADDTLSSLSDLSTCLGGPAGPAVEPFPCLADELEQQVKALEREW